MNINGKCKLYRNDYEKYINYACYITDKQLDGSFEKMRVKVQMPKGTDLANETYINVTRGFLAIYTEYNKPPQIKLVVMDYEEINKEEQQPDFTTTTNELPF